MRAVSNSQPFHSSLGFFLIGVGLCMLCGGSFSLAIFGAKIIKSVEMLVAKPLPSSLRDIIAAAPSDIWR